MCAEGRSRLSEATAARTVIVAGAGIGGLTAALALAARDFRVIVLERAERLEEVGAGLQLSANASHILTSLGVDEHLATRAVSIEAVRIIAGRSGREIVRIPFGEAAQRFGAPYWIVHRADLQAALARRVSETPGIELRLGRAYESCMTQADGLSIVSQHGASRIAEPALALIGADGVRSTIRAEVFATAPAARFSGYVAWRGTCEAARLPPQFRQREVQLWLGPNAHLVTYPISGGARVNVVIVTPSAWDRPGWSEPCDGPELAARFAPPVWSAAIQTLIGAMEHWTRWAMFGMPDCRWAQGRVALLGDASHAMLPFAAQGAAMAIEDAAVVAHCLAGQPQQVETALRRYGALRHDRVERVRQTAQQNGHIYHLDGPLGWARDLSMKILGGRGLLARQQWIYRWRQNSLAA